MLFKCEPVQPLYPACFPTTGRATHTPPGRTQTWRARVPLLMLSSMTRRWGSCARPNPSFNRERGPAALLRAKPSAGGPDADGAMCSLT